MRLVRFDTESNKVTYTFTKEEVKELWQGLRWTENEGTEINEELNRELFRSSSDTLHCLEHPTVLYTESYNDENKKQ